MFERPNNNNNPQSNNTVGNNMMSFMPVNPHGNNSNNLQGGIQQMRASLVNQRDNQYTMQQSSVQNINKAYAQTQNQNKQDHSPIQSYLQTGNAQQYIQQSSSQSNPQRASLPGPNQYFEGEFRIFREQQCQQMQGPFLNFCFYSLCFLLFLRVFVLEFVNIMHSLALPTFLVLLFFFFKEKNKTMSSLNQYLLQILVPLVVLIVAQKTISQSPDTYHLNESFLSWLVLVIFLGVISPLAWQKVIALVMISSGLFIIRLWIHFGMSRIRDDLYIHFITVVTIIGIIVRSKESLDRIQFTNLQIIKGQARHWHQVLDQLAEGVMLFEPNYVAPNQRRAGENYSTLELNSHTASTATTSTNTFQQHQYAQGPIIGGQITYFNTSLINILQNKKKERVEIEDLLAQTKFKVLFSTGQVRQNLKDYILRAYKSIADNSRYPGQHAQGLQQGVNLITSSYQDEGSELEGFKTYIKLQKSKKVIEMTVQKEISTSQCLVLLKEVSSYQQLKKTQTKEKFTQVLINSTAHNLFTPINGIVNLTHLLETQVENNPMANKYVQIMKTCLQGLVYTTQNMLELSRIRIGQFKTVTKTFDLRACLQDLTQSFQQEAKIKGVTMRLDFEKGNQFSTEEVRTDEYKLTLVLYNLVSNSVRFSQTGLVRLKIRLLSLSEAKERVDSYIKRLQETGQAEGLIKYRRELESNFDSNNLQVGIFESQHSNDYSHTGEVVNYERRFLHLIIEDNGSGIPIQKQKNLFQLFSNTKISDQNVNQAGLGLGLTVSHLICQHMGGNLALVMSQEGIGTKFSAIIPVLEQLSAANGDHQNSNMVSQSLLNSDSSNQDQSRSRMSQIERSNTAGQTSRLHGGESGKHNYQFQFSEIEDRPINLRDYKKNMRGRSEIFDRISGELSVRGHSSVFSNNEVDLNDDSRCHEEQFILKDSLQDLKNVNTIKFKNPFSSVIVKGRDESLSSLNSLISENLGSNEEQYFYAKKNRKFVQTMPAESGKLGRYHISSIESSKRPSSRTSEEFDRQFEKYQNNCLQKNNQTGGKKKLDRQKSLFAGLFKSIQAYKKSETRDSGESRKLMKDPTEQIIRRTNKSQFPSVSQPDTPNNRAQVIDKPLIQINDLHESQQIFTYSSNESNNQKHSSNKEESKQEIERENKKNNIKDKGKRKSQQDLLRSSTKPLENRKSLPRRTQIRLPKEPISSPPLNRETNQVSRKATTLAVSASLMNPKLDLPSQDAKILIVDDTAFNIEIMSLMIQQTCPDLSCDSATSGQHAIDKVKKKITTGRDLYRLILMDINMPPGIDGSEATRRIRKSWGRELKDTLIIAYTAIPKEQFGNPTEKKFDGILNKPCTPTDLKEVLKKANLI
ncbi:hypothetical protein FGO68_gene11630 [Halteria grandinella]|uniref:histidine kinase n=1 Tax=Halteria grandinella TaxID=5974 RepID=A0A8J8T9I5_HALGN|nr:hypothetical protein FGO68_gene11630 [Halteria grandinella]